MELNFSKSPSPVNAEEQREIGIPTKSGKKSRSKISPPSRIKDSRSKKDSKQKQVTNIKRSQTGVKKMKLDKNFEMNRKSHSSDYDGKSAKSVNSRTQGNFD